MATVTLRDWESHDGKHEGGFVARELARLVQVRLGAALESSRDMVSIVVPGLNEARRVEEALLRLTELDFSAFGLGREIIFVDGGSTDRTLEIAQGVLWMCSDRASFMTGQSLGLDGGFLAGPNAPA